VGRFLGANTGPIPSSGFFGKAPAAPPSGLWTAQVTPNTSGWLAAASDGAGHVLAVANDKTVWRSSNGGVSWAARTSIVDAGGLGFLMAFGNGVFIIGGSASNVHRSADGGATWSTIATGAINGVGSDTVLMIITDGAGRWVAGINGASASTGTIANYAVSTDNGLTWTPANNSFKNNGWVSVHSGIWDGSQFVAVGEQLGTGTNTIDTSPDGVTWTQTVVPGPAGTAPFNNPIVFAAGVYIAAAIDNGVFVAATPAGVATATEITIPSLDAGGVNDLSFDGTNIFAFDDIGGVARSTNGTTWVTDDPLNLVGTDAPRGATVYDAVNARNICMGLSSGVGSIANRVA
jgi:hypothetical protein